MTESELYLAVDNLKDEISTSLISKDIQRFYDLCHKREFKLFELEDEELLWLRLLSEVLEKELHYRKKTVLETAEELGKEAIYEGLIALFQEALLDLKRIDNGLDEDSVLEGLGTLVSLDASAELIIEVAEYGMKDPKITIQTVAAALKEVAPNESMILYKHLLG